MTRFVNAPNIQNFVNSAVNRVRYFLGFDAVLNSYAELETAFTPAGDFKAKIDFSTTSSAAQTLFGGELAGTDEIKLEVNTSGYVVASAYVGTSLQTAITSSVALDNGKLNSAEIVYTGTTAELFVNNVTIGTQTWALDGNQTIKYVGKLSTGTYFQGVPANPVLTDVTTPANSQAYRLDRATGTTESSLVNTGTLTYNNIPEANRFQAQLVGLNWVGNELVTNGNFATDLSSWTLQNSYFQWSAGRAYHPAGSSFNSIYQDEGLSSSSVYEITVDLEIITGGVNTFVGPSSGFVGTLLGTTSASGTHTFIANSPTNTYVGFARSSGTSEFYIDNVSVKRILEAP